MKKGIAVIVASLMLAVSSVALAETPRITFNKLKNQTKLVTDAILVIGSDLPSAGYVFSSNAVDEGCVVYIHSDVERGLRSDMLALLMAHEIAHCELDHHRKAREASPEQALRLAWEFEYEADALMVKMTRRLQIESRAVFAQLVSIFPDGPNHPSGKARLKALRGGDREYPVNTVETVTQASARISN